MRPNLIASPSSLRRKHRNFKVSPQLTFVFNDLVELLKTACEDEMYTKVHTDCDFELWTSKEFRTSSFKPKRVNGVFFAGASVNKASISFYFHPLYLNPELQKQLPVLLKVLWKQNSVFHITHISNELKNEIRYLIELGYAYYEEKEFVRRRRNSAALKMKNARPVPEERLGFKWQVQPMEKK